MMKILERNDLTVWRERFVRPYRRSTRGTKGCGGPLGVCRDRMLSILEVQHIGDRLAAGDAATRQTAD